MPVVIIHAARSSQHASQWQDWSLDGQVTGGGSRHASARATDAVTSVAMRMRRVVDAGSSMTQALST